MKADTGAVDYPSSTKLSSASAAAMASDLSSQAEAHRVLEYLLQDEVKKGGLNFKVIDGLTIENRVKANKAIPDDVLAELKKCDVILKGPTTTPRAGDPWPNIESANVAMRKNWICSPTSALLRCRTRDRLDLLSVKIPRVLTLWVPAASM